MVRISLAPVLSATLSRDSCWSLFTPCVALVIQTENPSYGMSLHGTVDLLRCLLTCLDFARPGLNSRAKNICFPRGSRRIGALGGAYAVARLFTELMTAHR